MEDDPILHRRSQALQLANTGQRVGYLLLGVAMVTFGIGLAVGLTDTFTTVIVICMALAAVVLGPSIILGYAAKAAEREERTGKTGH
ncbi:MAG: hypothetical protein QOI61_1057 [Actinomycetota bacterium]|jgi:sulfite exporter TauE/SafE